mgnify:CR=1 FL=1
MAKNLIPEIAKMLGVEIGEEFKIETFDYITYRFDNDGLKATFDKKPEAKPETANAELYGLLSGRYVKLPWKPKMYEEYWTFGKLGKQWIVGTLIWKELPYEILLLGKGWVYRTRAEAETALPAVAKEMGVEFIV